MSIFQTKEYLSLFAKHFVTDSSTIVDNLFEVLPSKQAVLLGMKPVLNGQEITDYGDIPHPSQDTINTYINRLIGTYGATSVQFDYIKEGSTLFKTLSEVCPDPPIIQEVAPFIALPTTWETYLESLERTDRKELKRKMKRLDMINHSFKTFEHLEQDTEFETFISLHKLSDRNKDLFMTPPMKAFFKDLMSLSIPGWHQKLIFLFIEEKPAATLFYFESDTQILLYNSGYDPEQKYYSAGLLLTAHLIKKSIEEGKQIFDFLRGNERYKYDLGGIDKKLYRFVISPDPHPPEK
jgi:hypothetical protein